MNDWQAHIAQGNERLRELYAMLGGIPAERFNLAYWREETVTDKALINGNDCGTSACAVGWACAYPPFLAQGLRYRYGVPTFKGSANWNAVEDFFAITSEQFRHLFIANAYQVSYGNKARVAVMSRVRKLLLKRKAITQERSDELSLVEAHLLATGKLPA